MKLAKQLKKVARNKKKEDDAIALLKIEGAIASIKETCGQLSKEGNRQYDVPVHREINYSKKASKKFLRKLKKLGFKLSNKEVPLCQLPLTISW